ncbi:hypothetical protein AVEN_69079-1 [Araneus ventricosus]|uniref:Uncharacterized protein n=1 Tax=Araneus ventricosus TaxID=182803 RepID=A0A4Y2QEU0_ARAVE|nr:hypothetical protein AVEN_69079-1 [Araneus ventricosus]
MSPADVVISSHLTLKLTYILNIINKNFFTLRDGLGDGARENEKTNQGVRERKQFGNPCFKPMLSLGSLLRVRRGEASSLTLLLAVGQQHTSITLFLNVGLQEANIVSAINSSMRGKKIRHAQKERTMASSCPEGTTTCYCPTMYCKHNTP